MRNVCMKIIKYGKSRKSEREGRDCIYLKGTEIIEKEGRAGNTDTTSV